MKKLKNIVWVRNLMLLSQLLLLGFVVQWIYSQYHTEKDNLEKELNRQFISSKQEVLDSVLLVNLVDPILNDKKGYKVRMQIKDSNAPGQLLLRDHTIETRTNISAVKDSCFTGDSIHLKYSNIITIDKIGDTKKDLFMHGVKLIYKEVSGIANDSSNLDDKIYLKTDTVLLKKLLASNLSKNGLVFNTKWISADHKDTVINAKSGLYFETNLFPKAYGVEISNYDFYLFKRILPQVLFALIMVLLSGAAFLIAYKSLKEQLSLSTLRNDFISNISHELKTPVSTVKVAIEALQDFDRKQDPKVVSEYLEIASLEMNRLDILIDKVMNTSLLENNKELIHPIKTELNSFLGNTLKLLQLSFIKQNAKVRIESDINPAFVSIDQLHIQGVIDN